MKSVPLPLACLAALIVICIGPTRTLGQDVVASTGASASSSVGDAAPRPAVAPSGVFGSEEPGVFIPAAPGSTAHLPDVLPARIEMGPLDVIYESILGAASKDEWQPLGLATFFTEGWDRAYVNAPEGTNEAPKQNWFGSADGVFGRLNSLNFFFTDHMTSN